MLRMWINQPSTLQPYHQYHGVNVLWDPKEEVAYFLYGNAIGMAIPRLPLSPGWQTQSPQPTLPKWCYL